MALGACHPDVEPARVAELGPPWVSFLVEQLFVRLCSLFGGGLPSRLTTPVWPPRRATCTWARASCCSHCCTPWRWPSRSPPSKPSVADVSSSASGSATRRRSSPPSACVEPIRVQLPGRGRAAHGHGRRSGDAFPAPAWPRGLAAHPVAMLLAATLREIDPPHPSARARLSPLVVLA